MFLAIILEEYLPLVGRDGRLARSRSLLVPWGLMLGGVGVWATTVFADIVHDMLVHTLWGDVLFAAGAPSWRAGVAYTTGRGSMGCCRSRF